MTIGGGGASSHARKTPRNGTLITGGLTFDNESEERIVKESSDVKMQHLKITAGIQRPQGAIVVSKQVSVTAEEFGDGSGFRQA